MPFLKSSHSQADKTDSQLWEILQKASSIKEPIFHAICNLHQSFPGFPMQTGPSNDIKSKKNKTFQIQEEWSRFCVNIFHVEHHDFRFWLFGLEW